MSKSMTKLFDDRDFPIRLTFIFVFLMIMLLAACGPSAPEAAPIQEETSTQDEDTQSEVSTSTPPAPESGDELVLPESGDVVVEPYPGADKALSPQVAPYPGPAIEGIQPEPPTMDQELPAAESDSGVVGGILIREIEGEGFLPFTPQKLILGEIITLDSGEPAYVGASGESPAAELLPTGIFVFKDIPPGEYNLVVDIGITQFLAGDTFAVEAEQVVDLGQVIIELPD